METILEGSSLKNLGGLSKKFFTEARKVFGGNLGGFGEKPSTGAKFSSGGRDRKLLWRSWRSTRQIKGILPSMI